MNLRTGSFFPPVDVRLSVPLALLESLRVLAHERGEPVESVAVEAMLYGVGFVRNPELFAKVF